MKLTVISIIISVLLIGGVVVLGKNNSGAENDVPANNVTVVDGVQIIEIKAKGGYFPRKSIAKAGMPTIVRFNTAGTFDCSSYVRIPSMNIGQNLSQSGATDINLGIQLAQSLKGSCGMGMYPFEIEFQD
ncbi:MAG: hypothetical protein A2566_01205 [Candidatus Zambryskibacteria bacterium RIFOXYD1_FULL_40_13]|nr:MAG: Copper-exporting ATPase [Parcubacteria group bacterium GW2011_GWC1_39_12]KKR19005.1 MAG: Copper-exporting ATPase [Parcubacteria group bacterium GW2011_GWF1_39_37]KKR35439.1 MAG: Copper-exporting ATPase [Parcubacteria group bacterium GW2011_GWC2_40_10]KKR51930.1 MAG: Copper-exporting ATPase [Parcubacteria group bacterium GW2011_GWE1_40_20]KKR65781.1 MAG: Copper-exporting ATPase [Parcubacteria group bacterium GW2011_GWB1_40_5]KKR68585.1 MAG: Copper-exporting ATPase [Parcubacteria group b